MNVSGISPSFPGLSLSVRLVTHALLTRPPLRYRFASFLYISVRLACVKHAASVRPEPGSNSPLISKSCSSSFFLASLCCPLTRSSLAFRFFATVQFSRISLLIYYDLKLPFGVTRFILAYHLSTVNYFLAKLFSQISCESYFSV